MRAPSTGGIAPRATLSRTVASTSRQSSIVRNEDSSIPRRSAGSAAAGGGKNCAASGRNRCGLRSIRSASACALSGRAVRSGMRRLGLGMPGGRPRVAGISLGEAPARVACTRETRIRTKSLKFQNSRPGKQVITGWRRRVGNDFRHRWGSSADKINISVHGMFLQEPRRRRPNPSSSAGQPDLRCFRSLLAVRPAVVAWGRKILGIGQPELCDANHPMAMAGYAPVGILGGVANGAQAVRPLAPN